MKIHVHFAFSVHFLNLFRVLSLKPDNQVPCQPLPRQFSQTDTHLFRLQSKSNMRWIWLKMRQLSLLDNAPNYLVEFVIQKRFIEFIITISSMRILELNLICVQEPLVANYSVEEPFLCLQNF